MWQFRILWRHLLLLLEANPYKLKLEQRLPGAGVGQLLFNGDRCFARDNEKALGINRGGGYITLSVFLVPVNCTPLDG